MTVHCKCGEFVQLNWDNCPHCGIAVTVMLEKE